MLSNTDGKNRNSEIYLTDDGCQQAAAHSTRISIESSLPLALLFFHMFFFFLTADLQ